MATKTETLGVLAQKRIAAAPNAKIAKAMEINNPVKRGDELYELGACTYAYGSCRLGPKGTIALLDKRPDGKYFLECAGHRAKQAAWTKKNAEPAKPKAKVTEMKAKPAAAPKEKLKMAAGPKPQ